MKDCRGRELVVGDIIRQKETGHLWRFGAFCKATSLTEGSETSVMTPQFWEFVRSDGSDPRQPTGKGIEERVAETPHPFFGVTRCADLVRPKLPTPVMHFTGGSGLPWCFTPSEGEMYAVSPRPAHVTCEKCRDALRNDPCAPKGFDFGWGDAPKPTPNPSLPDRYAAFRETVERVVGEEAPAVRVVTDFHGRAGGRGVAWLSCEDQKTFIELSLDAPAEMVKRSARDRLEAIRRNLGQRAMGAKE